MFQHTIVEQMELADDEVSVGGYHIKPPILITLFIDSYVLVCDVIFVSWIRRVLLDIQYHSVGNSHSSLA
jgi:hypothetical protein